MGKMISLAEYARQRGIPLSTAQQRARRGCYATAVKMGRDWLLDEEDEPVDRRITSGKYRNWRAKHSKGGKQDAKEESAGA